MSGLFTRNVAVLNIDGEHLIYRRDRSIGANADEIIFQNGQRPSVNQTNENEQPNVQQENAQEPTTEPNASETSGTENDGN